MTRFIGDIHGDMATYLYLIDGVEKSVQVGDFGIGFRNNPTHLYDTSAHRFIRGNHDNPDRCKGEVNWIMDGTVEGDIMYIGGATSIDKELRTEGIDWWPDEVPSIREASFFIDTYEDVLPRVLVTHDCPEFLTENILTNNNKKRYYDPSIIRQALDAMYEIHRPEIHIFGRWHVDIDEVYKGTRFICLNINSYIDLDI